MNTWSCSCTSCHRRCGRYVPPSSSICVGTFVSGCGLASTVVLGTLFIFAIVPTIIPRTDGYDFPEPRRHALVVPCGRSDGEQSIPPPLSIIVSLSLAPQELAGLLLCFLFDPDVRLRRNRGCRGRGNFRRYCINRCSSSSLWHHSCAFLSMFTPSHWRFPLVRRLSLLGLLRWLTLTMLMSVLLLLQFEEPTPFFFHERPLLLLLL
mmetsp:Transcript_34196/g.102312  ORF Transcript_34196/g.102312 Transcript_34196/m.102312 type:complete len:207 (+) Transcript_34196:555-1175(+)